jgi:hypothetical protein
MRINKHNARKNFTEIANYKIVDSYNYLGIILNNYGSPVLQLDKILQRELYLTNAFKHIVSGISFYNQVLLWKVYIRPYYVYVRPIIDLAKLSLQERFFQ